MEANDTDPERTDDERYAALSIEDDETVIYDQANHRAWLQSDRAVPLSGMA